MAYKTEEHKITVEQAFDTYSDLEDAKDRLESWRESLEGTNFENSDRYRMLEEAVDVLDTAISELDNSVPEMLGILPRTEKEKVILVTLISEKKISIAKSISNVCGTLHAALDSIDASQEETCPECRGKMSHDCVSCEGLGETDKGFCGFCGGNGVIVCVECNGTGLVPSEELKDLLDDIESTILGVDDIDLP